MGERERVERDRESREREREREGLVIINRAALRGLHPALTASARLFKGS